MRLALQNEDATIELGRQLAAALEVPFVLFLKGDLGAGKTTLMRALLQAKGHQGRVKSPTYGIAETYSIDGVSCIHLDLYRIADPGELEYLGVLDNPGDSTLLAVEWPEKGAGALPTPDLEVALAHHDDGRLATLCSHSEKGKAVCRALLNSHI